MHKILIASLVVLCGSLPAQARCRHHYPVYYYPAPVLCPPIYYYSYSNSPAIWGGPASPGLPPLLVPPRLEPKPKEEPGKEKEPTLKPKSDGKEEPKKVLPAPKPEDPKVEPKKEPLAKNTFDEILIEGSGKRAEPSREVKVGFFNHSSRDIVLVINGEEVKLPSEQYVTLRLQRKFSWGEKGQKAQEAKVPDDAEGLEVVFRK